MEDQDRDQVGVNGEPTVPASDRAATGSPPGGDDADTRTDTDDSFDRLLQEHVARSSDLMRQALALQSRSEVEIARARAEADRRLDQERRQQRAVLAAVAADVTELSAAVVRLSRRIDHALAGTAPGHNLPATSQPASPSPSRTRIAEPFDDASDTAARIDSAMTDTPLAAVVDAQPTASPQTATLPTVITSVAAANATPSVASATDVVTGMAHRMTVLVHGVPRAAAALSLQRHLAALPHVEGVEAREYAEGVLRLQVTAEGPLTLDDLRGWDGGSGLEPVHVQGDVIEVRLPGAAGC